MLITAIITKEAHRASIGILMLNYCRTSNWREQNSEYRRLRQWWDIEKTQVRLFCQQYPLDATKSLNAAVRELEKEILLFIFGTYSLKKKEKCALIHFIAGHAKLSILKSLKNKLEQDCQAQSGCSGCWWSAGWMWISPILM